MFLELKGLLMPTLRILQKDEPWTTTPFCPQLFRVNSPKNDIKVKYMTIKETANNSDNYRQQKQTYNTLSKLDNSW